MGLRRTSHYHTRFQPRLPERHSVARYRRQYRDLVHERIADRFNRGTWKHTHHLDRPGRECGLMRLARTISATKRRSGAGCNSSASTCRLLDPQDFSIAGAWTGGIARDECLQAITPRSLDPAKFIHHTFPPLADPFKRRFGLILARFRMVLRNIQFRITDVLDVTFGYVLNRNASLKKNG
jgi:hypothetical protein